MGRLDDISVDLTAVVDEIVSALRPGGTTTEVLAASIRHPEHVVTAARLGCEVATVPAKVFRQMLNHLLTEKGRELLQGRLGVTPEFVEWLRELAAEAAGVGVAANPSPSRPWDRRGRRAGPRGAPAGRSPCAGRSREGAPLPPAAARAS